MLDSRDRRLKVLNKHEGIGMSLIRLLSVRIFSRSLLAVVLLAASVVAPAALSTESVSALSGDETARGGGGGSLPKLRLRSR